MNVCFWLLNWRTHKRKQSWTFNIISIYPEAQTTNFTAKCAFYEWNTPQQKKKKNGRGGGEVAEWCQFLTSAIFVFANGSFLQKHNYYNKTYSTRCRAAIVFTTETERERVHLLSMGYRKLLNWNQRFNLAIDSISILITTFLLPLRGIEIDFCANLHKSSHDFGSRCEILYFVFLFSSRFWEKLRENFSFVVIFRTFYQNPSLLINLTLQIKRNTPKKCFPNFGIFSSNFHRIKLNVCNS